VKDEDMARTDVLVVGAGPTGLVLALWLARLGVKPRIIDKTAEPGTTSRALAVHARTLELYRQLDLADAVIARGHKVPAVRLWVKGAPRARVSFAEIGSALTPRTDRPVLERHDPYRQGRHGQLHGQNLEWRKICAKAQHGNGQKAQKRSARDQRAGQVNRASRHASRWKFKAARPE
jgi:phytoene dehydrogenase-like protein